MQGDCIRTSFTIFIEQTNKRAEFQFVDILYVYMLEELLQSGEISLEEGKMVLQVLRENYEAIKHKTCDLLLSES